jgi:predicted transcriptional regulator
MHLSHNLNVSTDTISYTLSKASNLWLKQQYFEGLQGEQQASDIILDS